MVGVIDEEGSTAFLQALAEKVERHAEHLAKIEVRNHRVEADKAWETSLTRVVFILSTTYLLTGLVFHLIQAPNPFRNAIIPTLGYFLSTLSLPFVKAWWLDRVGKF